MRELSPKNRHALLASVLVLAVACGSEDTPDTDTTGAPDSPSDTSDTGDTPPEPPPTTFGGDRAAELVVPASYDGETALPLVIAIHGFTPFPTYWGQSAAFADFADNHDVFYIAPTGTFSEVFGGRYFWNGTDACCDDGRDIDDSGYLLALIDEISDYYAVDQGAVFLLGHSNGAFMSYRMACDNADRIAGIAAVAGATFKNPEDCQPSEPVNILHIHADQDDTVLYGGGSFGSGDTAVDYPGALESAEIWAGYNGCGDAGDLQPNMIDFVGPGDAQETDITPFADCPAGGEVELWTIKGGGHVPLLEDNSQTELANWFQAHKK